jgi:hypothetical protein
MQVGTRRSHQRIEALTIPPIATSASRTMLYIQECTIGEPLTEKSPRFVYQSYIQKYQPFVAKIGRDMRTVDRALYTFGQFLKLAKPFWSPKLRM